MPTCKLCHLEKDLCQSHIVPEFIYSRLYDAGGKMVGILAADDGLRSHVVQKGLRETLLCQDCEQHINRSFEQPNVELWGELAAYDESVNTKWERFTTPDGAKGFFIQGADYRSFKLLLLSILWRASVSSRPEYDEVSLGPHEEPIRRMILEGTPGPSNQYPCILFKFDEPGVILRPMRQRLEGHLMYHFVLTTVQVWILVSNHCREEPMIAPAIREDGVFPVLRLDPRETRLFPELQRLERETKHSASVMRRLGGTQ